MRSTTSSRGSGRVRPRPNAHPIHLMSGLHSANTANENLATDDPNRGMKMVGSTAIGATAGAAAGKLTPDVMPLSRAFKGAPWQNGASSVVRTELGKWLWESTAKILGGASALTAGQVAEEGIAPGEKPLNIGDAFLTNLATLTGFTIAHGAAQARAGAQSFRTNDDGTFSFKTEAKDPKTGDPVHIWMTAKLDPDGIVRVQVPVGDGTFIWVKTADLSVPKPESTKPAEPAPAEPAGTLPPKAGSAAPEPPAPPVTPVAPPPAPPQAPQTPQTPEAPQAGQSSDVQAYADQVVQLTQLAQAAIQKAQDHPHVEQAQSDAEEAVDLLAAAKERLQWLAPEHPLVATQEPTPQPPAPVSEQNTPDSATTPAQPEEQQAPRTATFDFPGGFEDRQSNDGVDLSNHRIIARTTNPKNGTQFALVTDGSHSAWIETNTKARPENYKQIQQNTINSGEPVIDMPYDKDASAVMTVKRMLTGKTEAEPEPAPAPPTFDRAKAIKGLGEYAKDLLSTLENGGTFEQFVQEFHPSQRTYAKEAKDELIEAGLWPGQDEAQPAAQPEAAAPVAEPVPPQPVERHTHTAMDEDWVQNQATNLGFTLPRWQPGMDTGAYLENRAETLLKNPNAFVALYRAIPETMGGKILDGDALDMIIKGDHPEGYDLFHKVKWSTPEQEMFYEDHSDKLYKLLLKNVMDEPAKAGEHFLITVGAPGNGKSTVLRRLIQEAGDNIRGAIDTPGRDIADVDKTVRSLRAKGFEVDVLLVKSPVEDAVKRLMLRTRKERRGLSPFDTSDTGLAQSTNLFPKLVGRFGQTPGVNLHVIENVTGNPHRNVANLYEHGPEAVIKAAQVGYVDREGKPINGLELAGRAAKAYIQTRENHEADIHPEYLKKFNPEIENTLQSLQGVRESVLQGRSSAGHPAKRGSAEGSHSTGSGKPGSSGSVRTSEQPVSGGSGSAPKEAGHRKPEVGTNTRPEILKGAKALAERIGNRLNRKVKAGESLTNLAQPRLLKAESTPIKGKRLGPLVDGEVDRYEDLAKDVHPNAKRKFEAAMEAKDANLLGQYLHLGNHGLRAMFTLETGIQLPQTVKGTRKAIEDYFNQVDETPSTTDNSTTEATDGGTVPAGSLAHGGGKAGASGRGKAGSTSKAVSGGGSGEVSTGPAGAVHSDGSPVAEAGDGSKPSTGDSPESGVRPAGSEAGKPAAGAQGVQQDQEGNPRKAKSLEQPEGPRNTRNHRIEKQEDINPYDLSSESQAKRNASMILRQVVA